MDNHQTSEVALVPVVVVHERDLNARRIELVGLMARIKTLDDPPPAQFQLMRQLSILWHPNDTLLTATFSTQQLINARKVYDYCREMLLVRTRS
jgi:hypothetical protein